MPLTLCPPCQPRHPGTNPYLRPEITASERRRRAPQFPSPAAAFTKEPPWSRRGLTPSPASSPALRLLGNVVPPAPASVATRTHRRVERLQLPGASWRSPLGDIRPDSSEQRLAGRAAAREGKRFRGGPAPPPDRPRPFGRALASGPRLRPPCPSAGLRPQLLICCYWILGFQLVTRTPTILGVFM